MRSRVTYPLTDMHCHILPGVDDGAGDLSDSRALLELEAKQGVTQILFTPHFYADWMTIADFSEHRQRAAGAIAPVCEDLGISFACGAEVRMVAELMDLDLRPLAMADTGYFLLEWPFHGYPLWGDEVVDRIFESGSTPIFAHIERYDFFYRKPERLEPYIEDGILCQMNASTVIDKPTQRQALRLIRNGYVQLLATDTHNLERRPPLLGKAYDIVARKLGEKTVDKLKRNADMVFKGCR